MTTADPVETRLPPFFVHRPELVEAVGRAVEEPLTLIVAPGGFGKSSLLQEWAAGYDDSPVAWVTLDQRDDDGRRLATRLTTGLNTIDADIGTSALERSDRSGSSLGEHFIAQLLGDLESAGTGVLVLDEVEKLSEGLVLRDLLTLIDHAPSTLRVVMSTRFEPDHRWHQGPTSVLRQTELTFGHAQADRLLAQVSGRTLSSDQVDAILERTEGWPAGLQLFGLILRHGGPIDDLVEGLSGADTLIGDYLIDEVFTRQSEQLRRFLLQTSVLRRLCPELCRAVTGDADAADLLRTVERRSLFLVPVGENDVDPPWFRYHQLFQERIRKELLVQLPGAQADLLHAAAEWHLEQGDLAGAMEYLIEARDWERVLDLISDNARSLFERVEGSLALQWLQQVPESVRRVRPQTLLIEAMLLTMVGSTIEAEDVADALMGAGSSTSGERAVVNTLRTLWVQHHSSAERAAAAADAVLDTLDQVPPPTCPDPLGLTSPDHLRTMSTISRARARWYLCEVERARQDLQAIANTPTEYGPWRVNALGALGLIELWSGRLSAANQAATRALDAASQLGLSGHPSTVDALLVRASSSREHDELGRAEMLLEQALALATAVQRWVSIGIHAVERAALDLALMDPHGGLRRLAAFTESGVPRLHPIVAAHLTVAEARLRVAAGEPAAASKVLDTLELPSSGGVQGLRVQLCVLDDDLEEARRRLQGWTAVDIRSQIEFELWSAVLADADGAEQPARQHMGAALLLAEPEGYLRLFHEAGPGALGVLTRLEGDQPSPYLERVLACCSTAPSTMGAGEQIEMSPRELAVLRYLPGRFTNAELAAELFISRNTVKSHLHSIYRHLGVSGRKEAVIEAERRGLL